MPDTRQIAEVLWARCLELDHKPGRVQFTKYLYLVDYCQWRFKGAQATDAQWIFYHYGPWATAAAEAMDELAVSYGFSWGEEEETVLRFVRVDEPPAPLSPGLEGIIQHILRAFRNVDLNRLLDFAYNQTEPMLHAKRGEALDFATIPVSRTMPEFSPPKAAAPAIAIPAERAERIARFRAKSGELCRRAEERAAFRASPEYRSAMEQLAAEFGAGWSLPNLRTSLGGDSAAELAQG